MMIMMTKKSDTDNQFLSALTASDVCRDGSVVSHTRCSVDNCNDSYLDTLLYVYFTVWVNVT